MTNTNKLKALLVEHGMTQDQLAEMLNITLQSMNLKINNKREFWGSEIFKIKQYFKLTPEQVVQIFFALDVENSSTLTAEI